MKPPLHVLESCLYVDDLERAKAFYIEHLGAEPFMEEAGSHVFLKIGQSLVFLFDPDRSAHATPPEHGLPIPTHGAHGPGHLAFRIQGSIDPWKVHLDNAEIPVEEIIEWPGGGRSLYFRDPAGNSLELAEAQLWVEILDKAPPRTS